MEQPVTHPKPVREFFFWIGIVATFCYRSIVVLNSVNMVWSQIAWYVGTVGFVLYFAHRYEISERRAKLIKQHALDEKVTHMQELSDDERAAMAYIFKTLTSTKEKWNYIFIFVLSAIALLLGAYLDLSP
jgi:hypothetical protein